MLSFIVDSLLHVVSRKRKLSDQHDGAPKNKRQRFVDKIDSIDKDAHVITNQYKDQISKSNSIQSLNQIILQSKREFDTKTMGISNLHSQITDDYKNSMTLLENDKISYQQIIDQSKIKIKKLEETLVEETDTKRKHESLLVETDEVQTKLSANNQGMDHKISQLKQKIMKNMDHNLKESASHKMKQFELIYKTWCEKDLIAWIKFIADGKFGDDKYSECIGKIQGLEINGNKMNELNDSLLKSFGLNNQDRQIFLKHIDRVIHQNIAPKCNLCMICIENTINTVFTPCGHQAICFECYGESPNNFIQCSICREYVDKVIRTFMTGYTE